MIAGTNGEKRPRGRPALTAPEPIPDSPENVIKTVMRTRSKAERDRILKKSGPGIEPLLERQPQEPATSAPSQEPPAPSQEPLRKDFEAPEPSRRETPAPAELAWRASASGVAARER